MRHRNKGRILSRTTASRKHLLANLAQSIILYEKVRTTEAKAKEVRSVVERMITSAKKPTLAARRNLLSKLPTEMAVKKTLDVLGPRYADRAGGYTRITKVGRRQGDAAKMVVIELV
jgi:large subunit ribosomal protein L17